MGFKKKIVVAVTVLGCWMAVASCKKDKPAEIVHPADQLRIGVQPYFGSQVLYLDSTYVTNEGYLVQFTDLKFYATELKNGAVALTDAALFNYRETGTAFIQVEKSPLDFAALQGVLGVGTQNHADPTAFPNDSPLNITNAGGMHWGWNPGYIFTAVEAKVDTIVDGTVNLDHIAVLHSGTDAFVQSLSFPAVSWTAVDMHTHRATLKLDMQVFLANGTQTINLKNEYVTHSGAGQEALTMKAIQNFKAALSFMP